MKLYVVAIALLSFSVTGCLEFKKDKKKKNSESPQNKLSSENLLGNWQLTAVRNVAEDKESKPKKAQMMRFTKDSHLSRYKEKGNPCNDAQRYKIEGDRLVINRYASSCDAKNFVAQIDEANNLLIDVKDDRREVYEKISDKKAVSVLAGLKESTETLPDGLKALLKKGHYERKSWLQMDGAKIKFLKNTTKDDTQFIAVLWDGIQFVDGKIDNSIILPKDHPKFLMCTIRFSLGVLGDEATLKKDTIVEVDHAFLGDSEDRQTAFLTIKSKGISSISCTREKSGKPLDVADFKAAMGGYAEVID